MDDEGLLETVEDPRVGESTAILRYAVFTELTVVRSRGAPATGLVRWAEHLLPGIGPGAPAGPPRGLVGPRQGLLETSAGRESVEGDDRHWTDQGL